jgi:hypothetical protein
MIDFEGYSGDLWGIRMVILEITDGIFMAVWPRFCGIKPGDFESCKE